MAQIKFQFYRKGPDKQKIADITIDLKRKNEDQIAKWSYYERKEALEFMEKASKLFESFKEAILTAKE
jgi:hypothetical protein